MDKLRRTDSYSAIPQIQAELEKLSKEIRKKGGGSGESVAWDDITDKPLAFPPTSHTQGWATITGKPATFPPEAHNHTKSQITDFAHNHDDRYYTENEVDTLLGGKADSAHTHTKANITDFAHNHDDLYYTENEIDLALADKMDKVNGSITSETDLDALEVGIYTCSEVTHTDFPISSFSGTLIETHSGTTKTQTLIGRSLSTQYVFTRVRTLFFWLDWVRINAWDDISGKPNTFPPSAHTHSQYLEDAPSDNKQYARKNGAWDEVTGGGGGVNWSDIIDKPSNFPPEAHTHTKSQITDLADVVAGTFTFSSVGSGMVVDTAIFTRWGNVVQITVAVHKTTSTAVGSNIFQGTLPVAIRPRTLANGVGYYGSTAGIGQINASGVLTVRCTGASLAANAQIYLSFTYLIE